MCALRNGLSWWRRVLQFVSDTFVWNSLTEIPLVDTIRRILCCIQAFCYETEAQTNHKCIWLISRVLKLLTCLRSNVLFIDILSRTVGDEYSRYFCFCIQFQLPAVCSFRSRFTKWVNEFAIQIKYTLNILSTLSLYLLAIKCQKLINKFICCVTTEFVESATSSFNPFLFAIQANVVHLKFIKLAVNVLDILNLSELIKYFV